MAQERLVRSPRPAHQNFDDRLADRAIDFIEQNLCHIKGRFAGRAFKLTDWQTQDIREIFGRVNADGDRQIRQVYYEIPKKNGKSQLAAAIALKLLFADDEPSAEVYSAAADRDQASIVYAVAAAMVRRNKSLLAACGGEKGIVNSQKRIIVPEWESFYRVLSAEVAGKHGFNTSGCIFDEVHAQKDMSLWEVLTFGAGAARTQPLTFAITTAGIPGESPVAEMLHAEADQILRGIVPCPPDFYPVIYAAPDDADWTDEAVWQACNPGIKDGFLTLESVRNDEFRVAERRPSEQNSFRRLRLNQWVQSETRWLDMAAWDACDGAVNIAELKHLPCFGGLDLSSKLDLTSFVLVFRDENGIFHVVPWYWVPEDSIRERPNMEAAKYHTWIKEGKIQTTAGNHLDYSVVRARINEISKIVKLREIAFDPMFAGQLSVELEADGFTMVSTPQGPRHFTEPLQQIESAVLDKRLRHGGNKVLRWNVDCSQVKQDSKGGIWLAKPDRMKSGKRIDGAVAMGMAFSRALLSAPPKVSVYARRGGIVLQ